MRPYRIISLFFLLIVFGYFGEHFYLSELEDRAVLSVTSQNQTRSEDDPEPFHLVVQFYDAVEKNNWGKVKDLVTPEWWVEMYRSGYMEKWQTQVRQDPSLDFVMFLATGQKMDERNGLAWAMGKVDWVSSKQKMHDENEILSFTKQKDGWRISSIQVNRPVELVDEFYQTITAGQFEKLPSFLSAPLGQLWKSGELTASLKSDWAKSKTDVYCVFYLEDFVVQENQAWVKGVVLWNPLTPQALETPVTLSLTQTNDLDWKINKISGHWEIEK
ncbi:hypothetical protein [Candidatus Formimonas warabiya]|uniref:Uncharacterized protein n=1 Tax=Formimonas warabiya TaxID=1761012 RepID=A0A3G1KPI1_FORW1|nr:hypothetical protein [Candidatus Formimonas warabiya]ATW24346.1 hypothetical protein DCMF_05700 [Candidatus Formimonas warabiya]